MRVAHRCAQKHRLAHVPDVPDAQRDGAADCCSLCELSTPPAMGKDVRISAETFLEPRDFLLSDVVWLTLGTGACVSPVRPGRAPRALPCTWLCRVDAHFQLKSVEEQSWGFFWFRGCFLYLIDACY